MALMLVCSFDFENIENMEKSAEVLEKMRHGFQTWSTQFPEAEVSIPSMSICL